MIEPTQSAVSLLREAGLRRTRARQVVLEALHRTGHPVSHQEIVDDPALGRLDRVTLYRTLATLGRARLLHRVQGLDGVWRYCSHPTIAGKCGGNHIHFLCLECGQMLCLPEQRLPWVDGPEGAEVLGKQLVVYGRCVDCRGCDQDRGGP